MEGYQNWRKVKSCLEEYTHTLHVAHMLLFNPYIMVYSTNVLRVKVQTYTCMLGSGLFTLELQLGLEFKIIHHVCTHCSTIRTELEN